MKFVLDHFRLAYPDSTLILACDGGDDFSSLAKHYGATYFHDHQLNGKPLYFDTAAEIAEFGRRLKRGFDLATEDYLILLEDDVVVYRPVSGPLLFDINGCNFHTDLGWKASMKWCLSKYNPAVANMMVNIYYGGCGGCILRTSFFRKHLVSIFDAEEFCDNSQPNTRAADAFLSFVCLKYQGTIGMYSGFCETWHADCSERLQRREVEVLHGFKELY